MDKILYKKGQKPDIYLLCIPQKVASAATFNLHNLYGFHFSKDNMHNKLRKIIFCPNLEELVKDIIATCPICAISPKKSLYKQVGSEQYCKNINISRKKSKSSHCSNKHESSRSCRASFKNLGQKFGTEI